MLYSLVLIILSSELVAAGTLLWDGRIYNRNTTIQNLSQWDISRDSTHRGPYQYYIHGAKDISKYIDISPAFKHPGDTYATDGLKITIDGSSSWHGQPMMRTELVQEKNPNAAGKCFMSPNLKAETQKGTLLYHFSIRKSEINGPRFDAEHQINFFESHVVDLRYGVGNKKNGQKSDTLYWVQNSGNQLWETPWKPNTWLNFAYEMVSGSISC
jgi:glycosyl hydrolase family 131